MLLKVNGERNSGTSFLHEILKANFGESISYRDTLKNGHILHWAHGIPDPDVKKLDDRVIDIFIFRNLDSWLISMFKNPYELIPFNDFELFLKSAQIPNSPFRNAKDGSVISRDDYGKNIFDIRYYKYLNIIKYCQINPDCIFINLETLQNESCCDNFINSLKEKYGLIGSSDENVVNIPTQLGTGRKIKDQSEKNRTYFDLEDYMEIINKHRHQDIERDINNLSVEIVS